MRRHSTRRGMAAGAGLLLLALTLAACSNPMLHNLLQGACRSTESCTYTDAHGDTPQRHGKYERDQ